MILRYATLLSAVTCILISGYSYFRAVRATQGAEEAARIATWGAEAKNAFTPETAKYRTRMRIGSFLGIALFLLWEYLGAK